ncbi:MAG: fused MFS/spermidine synthase [Kiritimatiellae bacterium]|nr:fused MFS/spermidine synthase [Kiritimatiellia bacterium]
MGQATQEDAQPPADSNAPPLQHSHTPFRTIWFYRAAVFLSAFLLFQIQPMMSKVLLPVFGGSYLVWGTAVVFCQALLLLGYAYAHAVQRRLGVTRYARWHWLILMLPLALVPVSLGLRPTPGAALVPGVLRHLLLTVSLPFLTLATTSLVLQRWLSISDLAERDNPYVLYGASNLGSMSALLSYPVVVEPLLSLEHQRYAWWAGYALLILLHVFCRPRRAAGTPVLRSGLGTRLPLRPQLEWFLLSAAACAALLAATHVITFDIAPVPLLWVLPLSTYLLTFVLTFKRRPWYPGWIRRGFYWAIPLGLTLLLLSQFWLSVPAAGSVALHVLVLFVVCLNCHGRLYLNRPAAPAQLTAFYLAVAAGGFAGGALVSWVTPLVSTWLAEYPGAFLLAAVSLAMAGSPARLAESRHGSKPAPLRSALPWMGLAVVALAGLPWVLNGTVHAAAPLLFFAAAVPLVIALRACEARPGRLAWVLVAVTVAMHWTEDLATGAARVRKRRNFYGIYRVYEADGQRFLQHGTTMHGRQYLQPPASRTPLSYYHPSTPAAGILIPPAFDLREVGMIGLGTGALTAYARAGQTFTIYELDPDNLPIAEHSFGYLAQARARGADLRFRFGDGRVLLRDEPAHSLDVLIVDAFNSGSIPVHLLTVEAFEVYFRALRPDGLLLLHISNKALDLEPVVRSVARATQARALSLTNQGAVQPGADPTLWMAVSRDELRIATLTAAGWRPSPPGDRPLLRPWTDRYSNILAAMF